MSQTTDVLKFIKETDTLMKKIFSKSAGVLTEIYAQQALQISNKRFHFQDKKYYILKLIILINKYRFVYIWDTTTKKIVQRLGGHNGSVNKN